MSTLEKLITLLSGRSQATKWIFRYTLYWAIIIPVIMLASDNVWQLYFVSHFTWAIYLLAKLLFEAVGQKDALLDMALSSKTPIVPMAAPAPTAAPLDLMMNVAPDPGTHSTSKQVALSVAEFMEHMKYNGKHWTEAEIDYFLTQCKQPAHEQIKLALLNLKKPFVRAREG